MSHHYSGPDLGFPEGDPRLDFCDLYAFPKKGDPSKSILIMNFHPSSSVSVDLSPDAAPLVPTTRVPFSSTALYELKIDHNGDKVADITLQASFTPFVNGGQKATLRLIKGHRPASATDGEVIIESAPVSLDAQATITEAGDYRFFAGWRSDPFFFDPPGAFNGFNFSGNDWFGDKDVCSIAIEVPNKIFREGKNGLWARALTKKGDAWVQVDRGAIAAQSVFLTNDQREAYLATEPVDDDKFLHVFAHSLEHLGEYPHDQAHEVAKQFLPDILPYNPTKQASYPHNGRMLHNDVMGFFVPIITNMKAPAHGIPPHRDLLSEFPFVAPPHKAFASRPE